MKTGQQRDFAMSDQSGYELIMPFLPVQSRGGPYDDLAYAAGFEMGGLDARLAQHSTIPLSELSDTPTLDVTIHATNREQADLIAMRYGYTIEVIGEEVHGWTQLKLQRMAQL